MADRTIDRRQMITGGASALALLALVSRSGSAADIQSADGIAGGGTVQAGGGPGEFSVFGAQFSAGGDSEPAFAGSLSFLDVVGKTTVESVSITAYGPVEGQEATTRQLSGIATVNGAGLHPFNVILTDGGPIGSGSDSFELAVGADGATEVTNPDYHVQSTVQAGNIQIVGFPFTSQSEASPTPAG